MAKLDFRKALGAMAQTAQGMIAGQMAAEQELRRRQLERQQQEAEYDQTVLQMLPHFAKESQGQILQSIFGRAAKRAGVETPWQAPEGAPPWAQSALKPGVLPGAFSPVPSIGAAISPSPLAAAPVSPGPMAPMPQQPGARMAPARLFTPPIPAAMQGAPVSAQAATPQQIAAMPLAGAQPVPYQAPRPAPAPARDARAIPIPGFGTARLRGVDPKEVAQIQKDFGELQKWYAEQRLPEQAKRDVAALMAQMPPAIETEEQRDAARRVVESMRVARVGMGRFAQTQGFAEDKEARKNLEEEAGQVAGMTEEQLFTVLPGLWQRVQALQQGNRVLPPGKILGQGKNIQAMQTALAAGDTARAAQLARVIRGSMGSALKPAEETARMNAALRLLGEMDPRSQMDPETVRAVFSNLGVGHMVEGLGEGALRFGAQELEERWDKMVRDLDRFQGAPPARRQIFFNELSGLARLLGRKIPMDPGAIFKLDEETAAKIARDAQRFQWQRQDRGTQLALERLRLQRARVGLERDQVALEKAKKPGATGFTINQKAQALSKEYDRALSDYGNFLLDNYMNEGVFDPAKPTNELEQKAAAKWRRMEQLKKNYYQFLTKNGMDPALLEQSGMQPPPAGSPGAGKGKAGTGALLNQMADPNRPENTLKRKPLHEMKPEEVAAAFAAAAAREIRKKQGAR